MTGRKTSYIKGYMTKQLKELVEEKKKRLKVETLFFEEEDLSDIGGVRKIGHFIHVKQASGVISYDFYDEIPAITLVKIKDLVTRNRFYGEKNIKGQMCKIRLKS